MTPIAVLVTQLDICNPLIHSLSLRAADGAPLPGFDAGAHVRVQVDLGAGISDWRQYSLVNFKPEPGATASPAHYQIAVRREDAGRGGSRFMHQVKVGDTLTIEPPKNDFPLSNQPGRSVLIAGGIGVTPLASMAAQLLASEKDVSMVYAGRTREGMAFVPALSALLGDRLRLHVDAEAGAPLDAAALLGACAADDQVYVCGPQAMLDAVLAAATSLGWPTGRVHFELFSAPVAQSGDHAFEVELVQTKQTIQVRADQTLLDALIDAGCDPMFDCKRGECGVCATPVFSGEIDHRDYVLSASEKAAGNVLHTCVSRAKGPRLVLDL